MALKAGPPGPAWPQVRPKVRPERCNMVYHGGRPGPSWGGLGAVLGRSWAVLGRLVGKVKMRSSFSGKNDSVLCFHRHRCPPRTQKRMKWMKRMNRKRCQQLQHRPPLSSRRGQGLRQFQNKLPQINRKLFLENYFWKRFSCRFFSHTLLDHRK